MYINQIMLAALGLVGIQAGLKEGVGLLGKLEPKCQKVGRSHSTVWRSTHTPTWKHIWIPAAGLHWLCRMIANLGGTGSSHLVRPGTTVERIEEIRTSTWHVGTNGGIIKLHFQLDSR